MKMPRRNGARIFSRGTSAVCDVVFSAASFSSHSNSRLPVQLSGAMKSWLAM